MTSRIVPAGQHLAIAVASILLGLFVAGQPHYVVVLLAIGGFIILALFTMHLTHTLFTLVIVATIVFGRQFAQIKIGPLYATDAALALLGSLLLTRWAMSSKRAPAVFPRGLLGWTGIYLASGLLAAAVGWHADHYWLMRDAVLVAYVVVVPMTVILFSGAARVREFYAILFVAAIASNIAWFAGVQYPPVAFGFYSAFALIPPLVRWASGLPVPRWHWVIVVGIIGVQVIELQTRTIWIAVVVSFVVITVTRPRRLLELGLATIVAVMALAIVLTFVLPKVDTGAHPVAAGFAGIAPGDASADASNSQWRVDFWKHDLSGVRDRPFTGVGLGPPAYFCFSRNPYCDDTRIGHDSSSVSGPHNSFINVLYRTGIIGFVALLGLVATAIRTAWRAMRLADHAGRQEDSLQIRTTIALFAFAIVVAFFAVALENPYLGVPFWMLVGLLFVAGRASPVSE